MNTDKEILENLKYVRKAAVEARQRIRDQLQSEAMNIIFPSPGSVMEIHDKL